MIQRLDHAVVAVADLDEAGEATAALLGLAPAWRGEHPEWGTANTLFRVANTYLELLAPAGDGPLGRQVEAALAERGEGLLALAFGVDDAEACARGLREAGVAVPDPVAGEGRERGGARRAWRNVFLPADATRGLALFAIEHVAGRLPDSPALAPEPARVAALDHVVVLSDDLDAARRLYGEGLGLRLALDRSFPPRGIRILFFRVGGVTVEVAGPLEPPAAPGPGDRFGGLAWQVPDADAARERLTGAGFDVSGVRDGHKPGTRVCTVRAGTCGVPTLLIEPAPRLPREGSGR